MLRQAELYLSGNSRKTNKKSRTTDKPKPVLSSKKSMLKSIEDAVMQIKQGDERNEHIKNENFASKILYSSQASFSEVKTRIKNFYGIVTGYAKSKYNEAKETKTQNLEGWQIGIEFSKYCNFIFFPKKIKKMTSYLMDLGALPDRIHASPALCYF